MFPKIKFKSLHMLNKALYPPFQTHLLPSSLFFMLQPFWTFFNISGGSHTLSYHINFTLSFPFTQNALPPHTPFFFSWLMSMHPLGLSWLSYWPRDLYFMVPQNSQLVSPDTHRICTFFFSVCLPKWSVSFRLRVICRSYSIVVAQQKFNEWMHNWNGDIVKLVR